ncbi:MAG: serine/threonine-protein kinase [bacterium]
MQEGSQFGPYQLIKRIAYGGMAEIHLAKTQGIRGFERLLALKVIHPKYSEDQEFIDMLIDEAKIAVQLNHANIGRIFDLGRIESTYYIAMEFIDGKDLYQLLVRCAELDIHIPIDLIAFIGLEMAAGLQYAHTQKDNYGRPLNIIHRDISPQNILVSYDGEVKIVDFGIAKASQRSKETESGVIKGKFFYMSPEQAWGHPIDGRTDIFSTGICLYEMITGEMLYNEEKALVLLDKVRRAEIPDMKSRRPEVPDDLVRIALKALAQSRDNRYEQAEDLQRALTGFLYSNWPDFSRRRLVEFMRRVFGDQRFVLPLPVQTDAEDFDITSGKSVIFDLRNMQQLGGTPKPAPALSAPAPAAVATAPVPLDELQVLDEGEFDDDDSTMAGNFQTAGFEEERTITEPVWSQQALAAMLPAAGGEDDDETAVISMGVIGSAAAPPPAAASGDDPPTAVFQKADFGRPDLPPTMEQAAVPPAPPAPPQRPLPPQRPAPRAQSPAPRAPAPMPTPRPLPPAPQPTLQPPARARTPVVGRTAALDPPVTMLRVKKRGPLQKLLSPLGLTILGLLIVLGVAAVLWLPTLLGTRDVRVALRVVSVPPGADITLDGRFLGKQTPARIDDIQAGSTHELVLDMKGFERHTEAVNVATEVKAGEEIARRVFLKKLGGSLTVTSQPTGAEVYIDGKYVGDTPITKEGIDREKPEVLVLMRKDGFEDEKAVLTWGQETTLSLDKKLRPRGR